MPPSYVQTIMLVDDDKDALHCLRELLVARGYAVVEARDGEQALDYLRHNPHPCLILLDLMMPRMNGWEFLTHKAQDDKLAAVPVVITSGTEENVPTHLAAIRKPWNIANLLDLVRQYSLPAT
jgi:CheY-like chemotaxis protein